MVTRLRHLKQQLMVALVVAVVATLFAAVPTAAAAPPVQDGDGNRAAQWDERLENLYVREQEVRDAQAARIDLSYDIILAVQDYANALADIGVDVSLLQAGLNTFSSDLAGVEDHHNQAVSVLAAHVGFNDDGTVSDREAAAQTLRDAGRSLRDAHRALTDATIAFRRAWVDWRQSRRDT